VSATPTWSVPGRPGSFVSRVFEGLRSGVNRRLAAWLARRTGLVSRGGVVRVLEAGSGPVGGSSGLRRRLGGTVVALDVDVAALGEARRRDPRLLVVAGDISRLPFTAGTFDLVWNSSTLEHLADSRAALAEMARAAAPGGHVFVGVPCASGPLGFQPLLRGTAIGDWLGDVWTLRALRRRMEDSGLAAMVCLHYFVRVFVGVLARKPGPEEPSH